MATCFVIQPFDNGEKFDKRYKDTFAPAITEAGLEPYRVDKDASVEILIDMIEKRIRDSAICLVDISEDNPNVWFELGYALASNKPTCLICSEDRAKFPFDVSHRNIIRYKTDSQSDFAKLKKDITASLKAKLENKEEVRKIINTSPLKDISGLSSEEISALCSVMQNGEGLRNSCYSSNVTSDMEGWGYNQLDAKLALTELFIKDFIKIDLDDHDAYAPNTIYGITSKGIEWLLNNKEKLNLKKSPKTNQSSKYADLDNEIPF